MGYYTYGGKEHQCSDYKVIKQQKLSPSPEGRPHARQADGNEVWCAIADTKYGWIPGKATRNGDCYYPIGGKEHHTRVNFMYVRGKFSARSNPDFSSSDSDNDIWG